MTMESLADILEQELEGAFEVKDKGFLHRYITILTENLAKQDRNEKEHSEFREAILRIDTRMEAGFKRMDERFTSMDRRFESMQKTMDDRFELMHKSMDDRFESNQKSMDERFAAVDKRFDMMFRFMTLGFVILATMMSVYQFLA